jgi:methionyl-tRNA formyltransferase
MVIVFFGTPQFAVPTLEALLSSRHRVALVVTQPDKRRDRGHQISDAPVKAAALAHNVPVYQPDRLRDPDVSKRIARYDPDLGVVAAYGKLIPADLLRLPRRGMLNVHASLLPKYRGAAPVHRAVMNGDSETGVTIMRVVEALDAGDMLAKSRREIGPDDTSEQVERGLADDGARLLLEVLDRLEAGAVLAEPQDHSVSTYAPRLRKEEGLIDWALPARQIHDRVRGLYPWPHAYSYLDAARVIVLKTEIPLKADSMPTADMNTVPGTIIGVSRNAIEVATGDGHLAITELQPEGKRAMAAREFLAGRAVRPGMTFLPRLPLHGSGGPG